MERSDGKTVKNELGDRALSELRSVSRNNYFLGMILGVDEFQKEQGYGLSKQWLHNRAVHGSGIVFGLGVEPITTANGSGIVVSAGLAIDGWGREIIVPADVELVPLAVTDATGCPAAPAGGVLPDRMVVAVCYRAEVADPSIDREAKTVVEGYSLITREGVAVAGRDTIPVDVIEALRAGDLHRASCQLAKAAPPDPDDPCQVLANITVEPDGTLVVDDSGPRTIAPTNRHLLRLLEGMAAAAGVGVLGTR